MASCSQPCSWPSSPRWCPIFQKPSVPIFWPILWKPYTAMQRPGNTPSMPSCAPIICNWPTRSCKAAASFPVPPEPAWRAFGAQRPPSHLQRCQQANSVPAWPNGLHPVHCPSKTARRCCPGRPQTFGFCVGCTRRVQLGPQSRAHANLLPRDVPAHGARHGGRRLVRPRNHRKLG